MTPAKFVLAAITALSVNGVARAGVADADGPRQFNLVCDGRMRTDIDAVGKTTHRVYVVDLDKKLAGSPNSKGTRDIDVTPSSIIFHGSIAKPGDIPLTISRSNGSWTSSSHGVGVLTGKCVVAPFSGLPNKTF
jgi:hypothetical protein